MKQLLLITLLLGMLFIIYGGKQSRLGNESQDVKDFAERSLKLTNNHVEYLQEKPIGWPWRGITVSPTAPDREEITEDQIKDFAMKGINLIRLHIDIPKFAKSNNISLEKSIDSSLAFSDQVINWCKNYGIKILISSDHFPMNRMTDYNQTSEKFWNSNDDLDEALKSIKMLVAHFDKFENVVAYLFISEPILRSRGNRSVRPPQWNDFFKRMTTTIREVSDKYILYSPGPGGQVGGYADMGEKFKDPKIIYNFHFYQPNAYTHQGIGGRDNSYSYPGRIGATYWDKDKLQDQINVVLDWAKKEKVQYLFAGSFSVVRWADGKDQYISDVLSIFEENNISWSYHAFNGWDGWSYQYEIDPTSVNNKNRRDLYKSSSKTETQKILERFWAKNK